MKGSGKRRKIEKQIAALSDIKTPFTPLMLSSVFGKD